MTDTELAFDAILKIFQTCDDQHRLAFDLAKDFCQVYENHVPIKMTDREKCDYRRGFEHGLVYGLLSAKDYPEET